MFFPLDVVVEIFLGCVRCVCGCRGLWEYLECKHLHLSVCLSFYFSLFICVSLCLCLYHCLCLSLFYKHLEYKHPKRMQHEIKTSASFGKTRKYKRRNCGLTHASFRHQISAIFPKVPPLAELERNLSLALYNSHFAMGRVLPLLPSQVEIGTMHCHPGSPLPQVSGRRARASGCVCCCNRLVKF